MAPGKEFVHPRLVFERNFYGIPDVGHLMPIMSFGPSTPLSLGQPSRFTYNVGPVSRTQYLARFT